jgi:Tfp pilus assembly protein PilF
MNLSLSHLLWRGQAWCCLLVGQDQRALAIYERLLEQRPGDVHAALSRAHLLATCDRKPQAIEAYRVFLSQHAGHGVAWFNLGFLLEENADWSGACHAFEQAVQCAPNLDRAWYGLASVLIRLQRHDEAVVALKRNTELQPLSPYGWTQLIRLHLDRKNLAEAARLMVHLKGFEPKVAAQLERESALTLSRPQR